MFLPSAVTDADWADAADRFRDAHAGVRARYDRGELGFIDLPDDTALAGRTLDYAAAAGDRWEDVVILGIGGSALGPIALRTALRPHAWNTLTPSRARREAPSHGARQRRSGDDRRGAGAARSASARCSSSSRSRAARRRRWRSTSSSADVLNAHVGDRAARAPRVRHRSGEGLAPTDRIAGRDRGPRHPAERRRTLQCADRGGCASCGADGDGCARAARRGVRHAQALRDRPSSRRIPPGRSRCCSGSRTSDTARASTS